MVTVATCALTGAYQLAVPKPFPMLLLFAAACLGHLVLMVASHNWFYGLPLPRRVDGRSSTCCTAPSSLAVPAAAAGGLRAGTCPACSASDIGWRQSRWRSTSFCAGSRRSCVLPAVTSPGALCGRSRPRCGKEQSEVVDVVKQLGGPPAGVGKNALPGQLPVQRGAARSSTLERTLRLPRLPAAWDGLTILHLSDLHLCGTPDRVLVPRRDGPLRRLGAGPRRRHRRHRGRRATTSAGSCRCWAGCAGRWRPSPSSAITTTGTSRPRSAAACAAWACTSSATAGSRSTCAASRWW